MRGKVSDNALYWRQSRFDFRRTEGGLRAMAESSTNGKGKDEAPPATTTHESGPGDHGTSDDDVDILARGTTVGRYLVLERLGAGAMGVAYAAYDPKLDRKIALKLLRPQEGRGDQARRTARLEREAQAIAKLSHPNVVGIFDVGVHQGQVFLAMEYLGGGTLRDWLPPPKGPRGGGVGGFFRGGARG